MKNERIEIKKQNGDYNVYLYDVSNWPNWLGRARTMKGAREIVDRRTNRTIAEKYNWMACGGGVMGMV